MKSVSCGTVCGKYLDCGQHTCKRTCHEGACLDSGMVCKFPCAVLRPCGHPCGSPCHPESSCPKTVCRAKVKATCQCGQKTDLVPCLAGDECGPGFSSLTTEDLAACMQQLELGQPIGLSALCGGKQFKLKCDKDCAQHQRNKYVCTCFFSICVDPSFWARQCTWLESSHHLVIRLLMC
jgi:transcriptional repressor NF-X1